MPYAAACARSVRLSSWDSFELPCPSPASPSRLAYLSLRGAAADEIARAIDRTTDAAATSLGLVVASSRSARYGGRVSRIAFIDGRAFAPENATISAYDRGFLYGDTIFETIRTYGGAPFALDEHLERLEALRGEGGDRSARLARGLC